MAKRKAQQQPQELTAMDRLGLRVSTMINAPKAQLERTVTIHRLDTDSDEAWGGVMELLVETDGLEITFNEEGSVTLQWELESDHQSEEGEIVALEEPSPF